MKETCYETNIISDSLKLKARICKPLRPKAAVLFAHGLCSNHKEIGIFTKIEKRLIDLGCITLRFDFRGHGESTGKPEDISVMGEMVDLLNAFNLLQNHAKGKPIGLVAASFGASIFLLSDPNALKIDTAVLLNPVVNFKKTFLQPETPWGHEYFGWQRILSGKPIKMEDCMLSSQFVADFAKYEPRKNVPKWDMPIFIIHGDRDEAVPYKTSLELGKLYENITLTTIPGAGHGFDNASNRRVVIELTTLWLSSKLLTNG